MRRVFVNALQMGVTMVLTSHSMEECEMLCDRLGIMAQGQMQCLGSIPDLKRKFSQGYFVEMKLSLDRLESTIEQLSQRIEQQFALRIHHQTESTVLYQVHSPSPLSLFTLIESIKAQFHIETYSIQQTTLEQIFLSLL